MEPIKPVIQQALPVELKVREGDKVSLDCVIVAQPEPEVSFFTRLLAIGIVVVKKAIRGDFFQCLCKRDEVYSYVQ